MTYDHKLVLASEKWLRELTGFGTGDAVHLYWRHRLKRFDWDRAWFHWGWLMAHPGWRSELRYQGLNRAMRIAGGKAFEKARAREEADWAKQLAEMCSSSNDPFYAIKNGRKRPETVEEYRVALMNGMGTYYE